jgi:hypothetical protein
VSVWLVCCDSLKIQLLSVWPVQRKRTMGGEPEHDNQPSWDLLDEKVEFFCFFFFFFVCFTFLTRCRFNMLWLDQPALVGFSFHNSSSQPVLGDREAARESAEFLDRFLDKFFRLKGPLFLTGESFAGVYIPMLAAELIARNSFAFQRLAGFAIGNPSFRCALPPDTYFQTLYYHGLVSFASWQNWTVTWNCSGQVTLSPACSEVYNDAVTAIGSQSEGLVMTGVEKKNSCCW